MRILITGGAGFIGSCLCLRVKEDGHDIVVLDSLTPQIHGESPGPPEQLLGKVEFIHADVRDRTALASALTGVDAVVHFAAKTGMGQSQYEISRYFSVNVQAQAELLDLMST